MVYEVWLWRASTEAPDVMVSEIADDPLEAVFAVMRREHLSWAYLAMVFVDEMWVDGYSEFECPEREVC